MLNKLQFGLVIILFPLSSIYISMIEGVGRGVFPLLSKLSHGCVSNCRYDNLEDGRVTECRATVMR